MRSKKKLHNFLKLHEKWSKWLGVNQDNIHKNTIWHQCIEMVTNHFCFVGLNQAGYLSSQRKNSNEFFSSNSMLRNFIWQGYIIFQSLAIRRLTDSRPDSHSLTRLVKNLESNRHLINREVLVCFLGYPYEYKELLKEHNKRITDEVIKTGGGFVGSEPHGAESSKNRHEVFDRLSGKSTTTRKWNDEIPPSYWKELKQKLSIPEIGQIREYANKYVAHAADEKSTRELIQQDKEFSIPKIETCHKAILEVLNRLALDFWFTSPIVQTTSIHDVCYLMDKPFASSEVRNKAYNHIEEKEREYLEVQGIIKTKPP